MVYASNQAANAYRLNRFKWQVEGGILLQGLPEAEQNQHTFAFTGTETQQGATGDTGTTFNYSGAGTLSEHWGGSRSHC